MCHVVDRYCAWSTAGATEGTTFCLQPKAKTASVSTEETCMLWMGGVPASWSRDRLQRCLQKLTRSSVDVIMGHSFAWLSFGTRDEASAFMLKLNGLAVPGGPFP